MLKFSHDGLEGERICCDNSFLYCIFIVGGNFRFDHFLLFDWLLFYQITIKTIGSTVVASPTEPGFVGTLKNVTVPEGRDVALSCSVKNLDGHKVKLPFVK